MKNEEVIWIPRRNS